MIPIANECRERRDVKHDLKKKKSVKNHLKETTEEQTKHMGRFQYQRPGQPRTKEAFILLGRSRTSHHSGAWLSLPARPHAAGQQTSGPVYPHSSHGFCRGFVASIKRGCRIYKKQMTSHTRLHFDPISRLVNDVFMRTGTSTHSAVSLLQLRLVW